MISIQGEYPDDAPGDPFRQAVVRMWIDIIVAEILDEAAVDATGLPERAETASCGQIQEGAAHVHTESEAS